MDALMRLRSHIPIERIRAGSVDLEVFKSKCLMSRPVIQDAAYIVAAISERNGGVAFTIGPKDFLVAYLFAFYGFEDSLEDCARALVDHVHATDALAYDSQDPWYWTKLGLLTKTYEAAYLEWKPRDRSALLIDMCRLYWEYELVLKLNEPRMTPEELAHYTAETTSRQQRLLAAMRGIDDMRTFSEFEAPVVFEASVVAKIKNTLKRAFWDMVIDDISKTPADITRLLSVFTDARGKLAAIVGPNHRFMEDFDDLMDVRFVAQLHTTPATSHEAFWTSRCDFLIGVLASLDSVHMGAVHRKWWEDLSQSREGHVKCVYCLAYFMDHLEGLLELVQAVRSSA